MRIVAIEEHWTAPGLAGALAAQPDAERDESPMFNAMIWPAEECGRTVTGFAGEDAEWLGSRGRHMGGVRPHA